MTYSDIVAWMYANTDKLLHFICGLLIAQAGTAIGGTEVGLAAACIAAAAKETYDEVKGGEFSLADLIATIIGGITGAALAAIILTLQ